MKMTELYGMACEYRRQSSPGSRREIVRLVWKHDREEGLRLLARMLGVSYDFLYREGGIPLFKAQRNRARRGRVKRVSGKVDFSEVSDVAVNEAGGSVVGGSGGKRGRGCGRVKNAAIAQAWQVLRGN
ncbi:MAG: hypothetical protein K6U74_02285 [Firmicutes bacterium]|nr:hypothetical protein [Bacillota bacterium]